MNKAARARWLPVEITRAPMRTVRSVMLRGLYANPEKELIRLRDNGMLLRIAHGTYQERRADQADLIGFGGSSRRR